MGARVHAGHKTKKSAIKVSQVVFLKQMLKSNDFMSTYIDCHISVNVCSSDCDTRKFIYLINIGLITVIFPSKKVA